MSFVVLAESYIPLAQLIEEASCAREASRRESRICTCSSWIDRLAYHSYLTAQGGKTRLINLLLTSHISPGRRISRSSKSRSSASLQYGLRVVSAIKTPLLRVQGCIAVLGFSSFSSLRCTRQRHLSMSLASLAPLQTEAHLSLAAATERCRLVSSRLTVVREII